LIGLPDQPGSLHAALGIFAASALNLTKIESRPIRGELGKYIFFLDIEGHRKDEKVAGALQAIKEKALFLKILGSYPRAVNPDGADFCCPENGFRLGSTQVCHEERP